jgi:predicted dehydrogenase
MSEKIKIGIVGAGIIAETHQQGFAALPQAEIVGLYEIDEEKAKTVSQRWGVVRFRSYEELLGYVEAVVIATPPFVRLSLIEPALSLGRHIFCEKPLSLTLEEGSQIRQAVKKSSSIFMVGFNFHYDTNRRKMAQFFFEGKIGELKHCWARRHFYYPLEKQKERLGKAPWKENFAKSGGLVVEFCSHIINWLQWIGGVPQTIFGRATEISPFFQMEEACFALIDFPQATGMMDVIWSARVGYDLIEFGIIGKEGSLTYQNKKLWFRKNNEEMEEITIPKGTIKYRHFLECIQKKQQPETDVDDAYLTLKTCLAFNLSSQEKREVKIE